MLKFAYLKKLIETYYDLGELVHVIEDTRGYVNMSFMIETVKNGRNSRYFFRRYRARTPEEKVRFQHTLQAELSRRDFMFSPDMIDARNGSSYISDSEHVQDGELPFFFTVFEFLKGEDRYRWNDSFCTLFELASAARMLARFNATIYGWEYPGEWKEPRIIDTIPLMLQKWRHYISFDTGTVVDGFLRKNIDTLAEYLKEVQDFARDGRHELLPHLIIHGDFHPGNLKFSGENVTGVMDFDWAKFDARATELAFALFYFCVNWENGLDGIVDLDRVEEFIKAYQAEIILGDIAGSAFGVESLNPLSKDELACLPWLIQTTCLYLFDWAFDRFYIFNQDPDQYLTYLHHCKETIDWLSRNSTSLRETLLACCT